MPWGLPLPQWIPIHQLLLKFYPHLKTACTWLAYPVNAHHMTTTLPTVVEPKQAMAGQKKTNYTYYNTDNFDIRVSFRIFVSLS